MNAIIRKILRMSVKPSIVFESNPDFSDNTFAVFKELEKRNLRKKYYFIWSLKSGDYAYIDKSGNMHVFNKHSHDMGAIKRMISVYYKCKCGICSSYFLQKSPEYNTVLFFLEHGTPFKYAGNYKVPEYIDYVLPLTDYFIPFYETEKQISSEKLYAMGFARNDVLLHPKKDIKSKLQTDCDKIIVWYPTFRQHNAGGMKISDNGIPLLDTEESAILINKAAVERNVLIVVKPHPSQDISYIVDMRLSNIRFIDDGFFARNNITNYEFIGATDALLTDYSSVYYDYLLCDKPIGFVWNDIEVYRKRPGFSVDIDVICKGGEKIYTADDIVGFIDNVACDNDVLKRERHDVCSLIGLRADDRSSERVADFIVKKTGL